MIREQWVTLNGRDFGLILSIDLTVYHNCKSSSIYMLYQESEL